VDKLRYLNHGWWLFDDLIMIIRKYGIALREIQQEDLELIRQHRNSDAIQSKMIFRETISREQQIEWFKKVRSTLQDAYYLIYKNDVAMGLINGMNIDHDARTSEGGIFLWHPEANYSISILASIILNDWNFFFNDFKYNYAQVLKSNKQAISYNQFMGYKISKREHENPEVLWMEQSKTDYEQFRKKVQALNLVNFDISKPLTKSDLSLEESEVEYKKQIIQKLPEKQQKMYEDLLKEAGKL